ncbi:MAG TPA: DUF192 domain-containing protein [Aliidongia sp.]|uniref:DUF192 domain-containing protein n=1 Tax=Aliidongia sp. TaxID=1914230 RepID=UPI002DDDA269|nr:DUF192 domain-containing protein [Aliidongia sp.]HEV2675209.1 DUF192 domain-containing protein [Aliidongia sp.]
MRRIPFLAALVAVAVLLLSPLARAQQPPLSNFKHDELTITGSGGSHKFQVELATDNAQREQGLMFRQTMAADAGMLFLYDASQPVAMWMENTYIPLDMLFIAADGHIVNIRQRAVPHSRENIASDGPVKAVLELNGGIVARLGIKPGDMVKGPGLGH